MSKADDAFDKVKDRGRQAWGEEYHFKYNDIAESLEELAKLNSNELHDVLENLKRGNDDEKNFAKNLIADIKANHYTIDPKYNKLLEAIAADNAYLIDQGGAATYDEGTWGPPPDEKKHFFRVDLFEPKGASEALRYLIQDTEFTMQWGMDTLGVGKPQSAPDFSQLLDSTRVTDVEGWSSLRTGATALQTQLKNRQQEYADKHKLATAFTEKAKVLNGTYYNRLTQIVTDLNLKLHFTISQESLKQDGDKIRYDLVFPDKDGQTTNVVFQKVGDTTKYALTPAAEQYFYVREIVAFHTKWEESYAEAVNDFGGADKEMPGETNTNTNTGTTNTGTTNTTNTGTTNTGTTNTGTTGNTENTVGGDGSSYTSDGPGNSFQDVYGDLLNGDNTGLANGSADASTGLSKADIASLLSGAANGGGGGQPSPSQLGGQNGGMDAMSMMGPLMSMMMGQNGLFGHDKGNDKEKEKEKKKHKEELDNSETYPSTPADSAPPPTTSSPTPITSTTANTPPPPTVESMVNMTIDGKNLKVPAVVAQALNKEANNQAGSDARAAYAGTVAQASVEHEWMAADPSKLQTGDVVQWANRSALVVRDGEGLHFLSNGKLVPLDPNNPTSGGDIGAFQGYWHPSGIDQTPSGAQTSPRVDPRSNGVATTAAAPAGKG